MRRRRRQFKKKHEEEAGQIQREQQEPQEDWRCKWTSAPSIPMDWIFWVLIASKASKACDIWGCMNQMRPDWAWVWKKHVFEKNLCVCVCHVFLICGHTWKLYPWNILNIEFLWPFITSQNCGRLASHHTLSLCEGSPHKPFLFCSDGFREAQGLAGVSLCDAISTWRVFRREASKVAGCVFERFFGWPKGTNGWRDAYGQRCARSVHTTSDEGQGHCMSAGQDVGRQGFYQERRETRKWNPEPPLLDELLYQRRVGWPPVWCEKHKQQDPDFEREVHENWAQKPCRTNICSGQRNSPCGGLPRGNRYDGV